MAAESSLAVPRAPRRFAAIGEEIRIEILRKAIHLLIAIVPSLARIDLRLTLGLLSFGILVYAICEAYRIDGKRIPVISRVTALAARRRDAGKFVLGPVTLGLGAMLALLLYPSPAAAVAIYALAFGDGFSSLVGKLFGSIRLPFTGGKSLEGSLTCLGAVFLAALAVSGRPLPALAVAAVAMVVEAAPLKDFDNIVLPVLTGAFAVLVL